MENEDIEYDEIRGAHGAKSRMSVLNKKKVSSSELDELLGGELFDD